VIGRSDLGEAMVARDDDLFVLKSPIEFLNDRFQKTHNFGENRPKFGL
jgi:hypothetical protein